MYTDSEVTDFIGRANGKIAELSNKIVEGNACKEDKLLLIDLMQFLDSLNSEFNDTDLQTVLKYVHYFNKKARLPYSPYVELSGINIVKRGGLGEYNGIINVGDIIGLAEYINNLLANLSHQSLKNILGVDAGVLPYHITAEMWQWIIDQMFPFTPASVNLTFVSTVPSKTGSKVRIFEKGTSLSSLVLNPGVVLNNDSGLVSIEYFANDVSLGSQNNASNFLYASSSFTIDTIFSINALFTDSGTKTSVVNAVFAAPLWYGIFNQTDDADDVTLAGTKSVELATTSRTFTFTLPAGNANLGSLAKRPMALIPSSWGQANKILLNNNDLFDTLPDWTIYNTSVNLGGVANDYKLYVFNNNTEGTFTFAFKF